MPRSFTLMILTLTGWIAGCASLAPHYEQPAAPIPSSYPDATPSAGDATVSSIPWQDFFADGSLRELIRLALVNNRDLRVAILNIEQARAQYRVQAAQTLPTVTATGSGNNNRVPASLSGVGEPLTTHEYSANLGISAYELDLFGRVRSLKAQALEQYLATEEARRATQISLVAQVANAYLTWAADIERLALARETLRSQSESYELTQARAAVGNESELSLRQMQITVDTARVDVARYIGQISNDRNALALLIGTPVPDALAPTQLSAQLNALPEIPIGLPSELLLRRPDLQQAEHQLKASTANIGAARAAFYPRIGLTGSAGSSSPALSNLFESGSGAWSFIPQISVPLFDAGTNRANLDSAKAARDIALAQYEQSIQTAFREVADALAQRSAMEAQLVAQRSLVEASSEALKLSDARFTRGFDSYLAVLDAQRTQYSARQTLIGLRVTQLSNDVTLYKALGGGWSD